MARSVTYVVTAGRGPGAAVATVDGRTHRVRCDEDASLQRDIEARVAATVAAAYPVSGAF